MDKNKLTFTIRQEKTNDLEEIYQLIQTAFETAQVKDGDEQDFAAGLRNSDNYIPELALVAETNDKLIGHIMLTKTIITQACGKITEVLLLAPLSVLLKYRNQGIGGGLIEEACNRAKKLGYKAVFLCGNPAYYNRFGFQQTSLYNITPIQAIPEQYVLVRELQPGFLQTLEGKLKCC